MQYRTFANEIWLYHVETWYILQHCDISGPIWFCPEICHVGGRLIAAPTQTVPLNYLGGNFGAFVGANYPPGCFPYGETTSAHCADNGTIEYFANEIWRYHVETWYIGNIGNPVWPIRFCPGICHVGGRMISAPTRSVPLNYRAEISEYHPYTVCATELPPQIFRGAADINDCTAASAGGVFGRRTPGR